MRRENERIKELQMQISMYEVKCREEERAKVDVSPIVEELEK